LKGAIASCEKINEKRGYTTLNAISTVKEQQGPIFFNNSTIITKEELDSELATM